MTPSSVLHDNTISTSAPTLLSRSNDITGEGNFPQGCEISPDGLCVLTSTAADNLLRLYNIHPTTATTLESDASNVQKQQTPERKGPSSWQYCLSAQEGDSVRTYCWYPLMNSYDPATCAFAAASRCV